MKKITNVAIGGKSFIISEEACGKLDSYLNSFESMLNLERGKPEVMEDLEERIAELFCEKASGPNSVVDTELVRSVIMQLGMPDGSTPNPDAQQAEAETSSSAESDETSWIDGFKNRRYYRDPDGKKIGGVCTGLSVYFDIDVTIVRIMAVILACCYGVGIGLYLLLWLLAPKAVTPVQKCELRGIPATAANMYKFNKK